MSIATVGFAQPKAVEIVAHRGASFNSAAKEYAPENTVAAAKLAWEMNADGVEIDVYLTADKRVMLMHDESTSRTTAGASNLLMNDTTSTELRKLDVGAWYHSRYSGEKIPFIEEVIATVPDGKYLVVEIKDKPETVKYLSEIFNATGKRAQMKIISFKKDVCVASAELMPDVPVYYLRGAFKDEATGKYLDHPLDYVALAKECKLTGLDVSYTGTTPAFCKAVLDAQLGLWAWTVDSPTEAKRLAALGVQSITTNVPDLIRKTLAEK